MWVTEPCAMQKLGISSAAEVREAVSAGKYPHVLVEQGSAVKSAKPPFTQHRFYYITTEGESAQTNLSLKLLQWISVCQALGDNGSDDFSEMEPRQIGLLARYAGKDSIDPDTFGTLLTELKAAEAVILPGALSQVPATDDAAANGASLDSLLSQPGAARPTGDSHTVSGPMASSTPQEGEIYIRADGKKVRRVKKKPAAAAAGSSLSSHLGTSAVKAPGGDSATVPGNMGQSSTHEEGEIYIRADGKKVRRVKKKKPVVPADSASVAPTSTSLGSMLDSAPAPKAVASDSATVPGNMGQSAKAAAEEGEIYIRADGKKVRRVKKKPAAAAEGAAAPAEEGEIYIRADGKKVRRVKKKPAQTLDSMLGSNLIQNKVGSGSATVTGAEAGGTMQEGEIYIRPDGKKVRRIKKVTRSLSGSGKDLGGFLGSKAAAGPKGGSATVAGDGKELGEIYIRADGKKVRRVKRAPQPAPDTSQSLAGFLDTGAPGATGFSGSATVTGAEGRKAQYAEGEIYIRPDGKKVRRIRKTQAVKSDEEKKKEEEEAKKKAEEEEAAKNGEENNDEAKPEADADSGETKDTAGEQPNNSASAAGDLAGFLDTAADAKPQMSGSATVAGDMVAPKPAAANPDEEVEIITREDGTKVRRIRRKVPAGGAGESTGGEEGEIFVRPDGTKVRRVRRSINAATAGDEEGEIITRPDGTRVRRIVRRSVVAVSDGVDGASADPAAGEAESPPEGVSEEAEAPAQEQAQEQAPSVEPEVPKPEEADPALEHVDASEPTPDATTEGEPSADQKEEGNHAYIVVVGDENKGEDIKQALEAAPDADAAADPTVGPNGEERFAVKVAPGAEEEQQLELKVESDIRYLTLDELANLSGKSEEDLNEVVKQKMHLDSATPRFVLSSPDKPEENAAPPAAAAPAAAPASASKALPPGASVLPAGQVAVSEDVAKAAEAVTAMGATDLEALMAKLATGDVGEILKKLKDAEKRQAKLEKQLQQAGVAIADDIPYEEAKEKVEEIAKRMNEIGGSDVTHPDKEEQTRLREEYFKLEQNMERFNTALMVSDEYQAEQDRIERKWEEDNFQANLEALKQIRRHMPVNVRNLSEAALTENPSPNGKFLPKATAKKFKRTNVLMLLRLDPDDIERMHPASLDTMRVTGLTLTERRALYCHLQPVGPKWNKNKAEKMTERKWTWYNMMKNNFKEALAPYQRHIAQYGPPDNHPYATRDDPSAGCPLLGKQCPVKADKNPDYTGDYGWTEEAKYEASSVTKADVDDPGAKAMAEAAEFAREKKANERGTALKKHYKGVMFVSKANGSCEQMDETMDNIEAAMMKGVENMMSKDTFTDDDKKKEITHFTEALNALKLSVLDFAGRSGMQTSGKKKAGGDGPDMRSSVECALANEVWECAQVFFKFIKSRMDEMKVKDTRVSKTIELIETMLGDLHGKNEATLKKLKDKVPTRSRKLKTLADMKEEQQKKMAPKESEEEAASEEAAGPPRGGPGRGGLLGDIAGRGGGGRGGLLGDIAGRGRGGGGRGGLLGDIAGRGRGGRGGGGRGGLMDAIAGRGRGGGPPGGGRGGLMAAIAGRGAGPPGGGGGRGGKHTTWISNAILS